MNWLHDPITNHSFHPDCFAGFLYQGHPQHRQSQTVVFVHAFHCLVAGLLASHQEGSCQGTPSMTCWCQSAGFVWGGGEDQAVKTTMAWSYPFSSVMNFGGEIIPCKRFLVPKSTQPRSHLRSVRCESMAGAAGTCLRSVSWTAQFRYPQSSSHFGFPYGPIALFCLHQNHKHLGGWLVRVLANVNVRFMPVMPWQVESSCCCLFLPHLREGIVSKTAP